MVGCSVLGCKSRSERKVHGITFHSFPANSETQKIWLDATGRQNWQPNKYCKMCSIHFDDYSFVYKKKSVQLKPHSVPKKYIHIKVTSGPTAQFEQQTPPYLPPEFPQPMIEEIKDESADLPSDEDTLSVYGELDFIPSPQEQSDEDQIIEAVVPLSDAPDPLCDVKEEEDFGSDENVGPKEELDITEEHLWSEEESDGPENTDGNVEELSGTIKEENGMAGVNHVGVISLLDRMPMRAMLPNMAKQGQRRDPEQSIKSITKRCDQALLKVRNLHHSVTQGHTNIRSLERQLERLSCFVREHHGDTVLEDLLGNGIKWDAMSKQRYPEMIKQRDEMIIQLQAEVESLRNGTRGTSGRQNGAVVPCGTVVPRIKIQSINTDERLKKVNRQLLITKHNNRKKSSVERQTTSNSRQNTSNQGPADVLQKSLVGPTLEIPPMSLAGVKRKVQVQQKSVVPATSLIPLIGKKRKSDVRQNPSVVIHPKLDIRQITPISDISKTSFGLQRTPDVRQNSLVIQIDGMHNTVLQPKLVRLDDSNTELG